jgi:hypothetical protein
MASGVLSACALAGVHPGDDVAPADAPFTVVDIDSWRGPFKDQMRVHLMRAAAIGQVPYVELTAVWCGPCHAIEKALPDTAVMRSLRGTYIMRVDVDHWTFLSGTPPKGIPAFVPIDSAGRWLPRRLVGAPSKPADIAAAFEAFFHGSPGSLRPSE